MRVMLMTLVVLLSVNCDNDSTSLEVVDLRGTWKANLYEYTDNNNPQNVVDVIQRDGASFTIVIDADGRASTVFDDGLGGTSSDSGALNSSKNVLMLGSVQFSATRDGDLLQLTHANAQFDFGSGSSVLSTLRIVLRRD